MNRIPAFLFLGLSVLASFIPPYCTGQNKPVFADKRIYLIDSLDLSKLSPNDQKVMETFLKSYAKAKTDTSRLIAIGQMSVDLENDNLSYAYARLMLKETEKKLVEPVTDSITWRRYHSIAGVACHTIAYYYTAVLRDEATSEKYNLMSVAHYRKTNKRKKLAAALSNLGANYFNEGRIKEATKITQEALSIQEEIKDTFEIAVSCERIGNILRNQEDIPGAKRYFLRAIRLFKAIGHEQDMANTYNLLGICLKVKKQYDSALVVYNQSLAINEAAHKDYGIATILLNEGVIMQDQGDLKHALENYEKSLALFEKSSDKNAISYALNSIALLYYKQKDYAKAASYAERDMALSREIHYPENIMNAAQILSQIYRAEDRYKDALDMHELYFQMHDSVLNAGTKRDAIEKDLKYQHDRDMLKVEKEREKEALAAAKDKEKRNVIIGSVSLGMVVLTVFLFFLYNRFRIIRKQKNIIEKQKAQVEIQKKEIEAQKDLVETKQEEIVDSILYAKRLQEAILPAMSKVQEYLPSGFVLYKPKDIVAGDFYWMEKVGDELIVCVADCTGHGVPGAMVSFVCVNALNRAVLEYGLHQPAAILDKVSELVRQAFSRSESEVKDGMDISLCTLNTKTNVLSYAGAFNPLWILRKGSSVMEEYAATRQAVGNVLKPIPFKSETISLQSGDAIFLFSDGFSDQFGGPKGKKLKHAQFNKMLVESSVLEPELQRQKLDFLFENWKGNLEQIDDVCVIGMRIN